MRRALLLAAFLSMLAIPSSAAADTGVLVHGAGTFSWDHCATNSTASVQLDATGGLNGGTAAGTFTFACSPTFSNPGGTWSGTVTCVRYVVNSGQMNAVVGVVTTASTVPGFPVGQQLDFAVEDGGPAGIDRISELNQSTGCSGSIFPDHPITGDITIVLVDTTAPATVVLTPPIAINDVGTTHTVTATATSAVGTPSSGFTVFFTVTGSVSTAGQCTTDAQGQCTFTYAGPQFPGADMITGCADANGDGHVAPGEPCGDAMKVWMLPATTPGQVTGGGWIPKDGDRVFFGFHAESDGVLTMGGCNVIDRATMTHIRCTTVDTLVVEGTHATLFGNATVDELPTRYRIDVDDLGEPSTSDTFKIVTDSGYAAAGTLEGGNIQIHHS